MQTGKILLGAVVTIALLVPKSPAQNDRRSIYSRPTPPPAEALRRLNLHQAWSGYVPMDGGKDAFLRIAFDQKDLIALTRSGMVTRINAETGHVNWQSRLGKPYTLLPYLAINRRSVYVISNATMIALNRETGSKRWEYPLPGGISAPPGVDKTRLYLPTATSVLFTFNLPFLSDASGFREAFNYRNSDATDLSEPRPLWSHRTELMLSFRPLVSRREVLVVSPEGQGIGFRKTPTATGDPVILYAFDIDHRISVPPTSFADTAYLGGNDATLYAINMRNGRLRWRHVAGTSITRSPIILDNDVYFTSLREGLARLDRVTGQPSWKIPYGRLTLEGNPLADRYLASNDRFVYANDRSGRLVILDRKRGTVLSTLDTTAFRFPVVNDVSDRLYLAANDGLIVCLHDRDVPKPILLRKALEDAVVQKVLDEKITEPVGRDVPLQEVLATLEDSYELDFLIDKQAWADAKLDTPERKLVKLPTWDNRPLREYIQKLLDDVDATFRVDQEILRIIPKPPRVKKEAGTDQP